MADMTGCMDARIGPSASDQVNLVSHDAPDRLFYHTLDGSHFRLKLPTVEIRPVICHKQIDRTLHPRDGTERAAR